MSKRILIVIFLASAAVAATVYGPRVMQREPIVTSTAPVVQAAATPPAPANPTASTATPEVVPEPPAIETPPVVTPVLTNSMRDIVVTVESCTLSTRTLRCSFVVTNQSPAEKPFNLGIGGSAVPFNYDRGGAVVFDDLGNDFVSVGGGVANRSVPNCDYSSQPCEVQKILTPNVKTSGWIRFDAVDPRANAIKLLRMRWSDGEAWLPMDFRNVPFAREALNPIPSSP